MFLVEAAENQASADAHPQTWTPSVATAVAVGGVALAAPAQAQYPVMPNGVQGPFVVTRVVDGDTIHVDADGKRLKIRMIGLDTPESKIHENQCSASP